ncbi:MAG: hypothetical protein KDJ65_01520 [Anaerolineae bacterium]|nr:hypothetical protein [Anaerolineae bacterium]
MKKPTETTDPTQTQPTKSESTGLTNAIETVLKEIEPRYQQLKLAHQIVTDAGDREVPRSTRVDARKFNALEAALTELRRWKAQLETV